MSSSPSPAPKRGDIWLISFDPTVGAEIRKTRPAIVVSSDGIGRLPIKLVAPVTDWKASFAPNVWHVRIDPEPSNGLTKPSAVDVLQLRGLDLRRFYQSAGRGYSGKDGRDRLGDRCSRGVSIRRCPRGFGAEFPRVTNPEHSPPSLAAAGWPGLLPQRT